MVVYTKTSIGGQEYSDILDMSINKSISDFNSTSNFTLSFSNYAGEYDNTFNLNDEVQVWADKDTVIDKLSTPSYHFKCNDTTGDVVEEISGNNGTISGGVTRGVEGKINDCYEFDGVDGFITLDSSISLPPTSFSIAWWMKRTATDYECIFAHGANGIEGTVEVDKTANKLRFESRTNNIYQKENITTGLDLTDGQWHHFVIVSSQTEFCLYSDGVKTYTTTPNTDTANQTFKFIGRQQSQPNYGDYFMGNIDDIRFYNIILSQEEVTSIYNENRGTEEEENNVQLLFTGVVEDIEFSGSGLDERITLSGRDYGAVLQDIIVEPRNFSNMEISEIILALMTQNAPSTGISTNNVNSTSTTLSKIAFKNISLYDAIGKLAELAGYYFYVDKEKDLHFEQKETVNSGIIFGLETVLVPIYQWKLNEGTGSVAYDTISSKVGVVCSGAEWAIGKVGSCILFNGSDSQVAISGLGAAYAGSNFSLSCWINYLGSSFSQSGGDAVIFGNRYGDNTTLVVGKTGSIYMRTDDSGIWDTNTILYSGIGWKHLTWVYNIGSSYQNGSPYYPISTLYIDGAMTKTGSYLYKTGTPYGPSQMTKSYIGWDSRYSYGFNGLIDDLRIWQGSCLTTEQISYLYASCVGSENININMDTENVLSSNFKMSDSDIYNKIIVYGDRQLTGVEETFVAQTGSLYSVDDFPHNVVVIGSGTVQTKIQPGGILNVDNPGEKDVKFLVDYNNKKIILTSGTVAGDNRGWTGSDLIIDYQRTSPIISIKQDLSSQVTYGRKDKTILDKSIRSITEANQKAETFLNDHKEPKTQGTIDVYDIVNVTPGNTAYVNMPFYNINNEEYTILNANYNFDNESCFTNRVLRVDLNKKVPNYIDYVKELELRLRALEGADIDTISNFIYASGVVTVESSYVAVARSIGSAFYFNVPGHDILNSPGALLGDARAGSTVFT